MNSAAPTSPAAPTSSAAPTNAFAPTSRAAPIPLLFGLVLAGGESRRMGADKGALAFRGEPQARRAWRLLNNLCVRTYVSIRAEQAKADAYRGLPLILDARAGLGPAGGLATAWAAHPDVAWLVLATDMPLVDAPVLQDLIRRRDPSRLATCFRQPDGVLQPLCAIWEPQARPALEEQLARGDASLRRLLESGSILELVPPDAAKLESVDTQQDYHRLTGK